MYLWSLINSCLLAAELVILYLVIRQVGALASFVGPLSARSSGADSGPRIGENISVQITNAAILNAQMTKPLLILFLSSSCSICRVVREAAVGIYGVWKKEVDFCGIYDADDRRDTNSSENTPFNVVSNKLRLTLGVGTLPYGIVVLPDGTVLGRGLLNHSSHIESLLELLNQSN